MLYCIYNQCILSLLTQQRLIIMNTTLFDREIDGTYGSAETPCTIFVVPVTQGQAWYIIEGSGNANLTDNDLLVDGVDVELLADDDHFTCEPVGSLDEFATLVEDY